MRAKWENLKGCFNFMKIGIDIQSTQGTLSGIGYYTRNLLENIKSAPGVEVTYYKHPKEADLNTIKRIYWENISLPKLFRKDDLDILHLTGFAGPWLTGKVRKITTVNDLIGMIYPGNLAPVSRFYWQRWLPACVKNSRLIIAISEHTKRDIVRLLGIPPDKIKVTYLAANKSFRYISDRQNLHGILKKYGINSKYILSVGTIEPRKNFALLIRAFALYLARVKKEEISLVIVGRYGWAYNECLKAAMELGIQRHIIFCDYVDDADLPIIYNMAELFIFPSLYEGFGLPVLEAMCCRAPVICSNTSSLPEVTADAAILIDPLNKLEMANAIENVLSDGDLKKSLSDKAMRQSSRFSWAKTANETIAVYKEVMSELT